jgi:hypothetical protein
MVTNDGANSSGPVGYRIEYAPTTGGPWAQVGTVPTFEHWYMSPSTWFSDGAPTSDISPGLTTDPPDTTFVAGELRDASNATSPITLANNTQFTELEYSIEPSGWAISGQTYYFRVTNVGSTTGFVYTRYGQVNMAVTTAVKLAAFTARGLDSSVRVEWQTTSELDNLGFHLYRAPSAAGPWQRLNAGLIPGLGSSPEGKSYSFLDTNLKNGTSYFYRLEDLDRVGRVTAHGPVAAIPSADATDEEEEDDRSPQGEGWKKHGDPDDVSLQVLERSARGVTLELRTGGFYSKAQPDGSQRLFVPGFLDAAEPGMPAVPVKRAWVETEVGRGVRVAWLKASDVQLFHGLLAARAGAPEARARRDGTYRAAFRRVLDKRMDSAYPREAARVLETAFQDELKKAYLELAPLRVDGQKLVLARRIVLRLAFDGRVPGETSVDGRRGRRRPAPPRGGPGAGPKDQDTIVARLAARAAGLHAVAWESLAGSLQPVHAQGLSAARLRLSRLGQAVAFHVEPQTDRFGPGSTLYFLADGPETAYGTETVYELEVADGGVRMPVSGRGAADPALVPALVETRRFEQNANYLPALLNARDFWFWDAGLLPPNARDYSFSLAARAEGGTAVLTIDLQGASDATGVDPDHLVRALVNGVPVGEASWDGLEPARLETSFAASVLVEGENTLRLENLDTTGGFDSAVLLDRFSIEYRRALAAESGTLSGRAETAGLVRATGFPTGAVVLDLSGKVPSWLVPAVSGAAVEFPAEPGKSYLATAPEAVLRPEPRAVLPPTLRNPALQADWIVIAPKELMPAVEPLVAHRQSSGLRALAVSLEQVRDEFGHGERSPQMLREFLSFAYHSWAQPSLRYVLLLGDASYDPKGYMGATARQDLLPTPLVRSTFLWTPSDPWLAAVNGDDSIPDLAIGRLSAGSLAEAEAAVAKVLAFEGSAQRLDGKAVLVADNPDSAGDFEANVSDIASLLPDRPVDRLLLTQLGAGARPAVLAAFDAGASLVSYVGHGSQALWASERILISIDAAQLRPQPRQPLLLTMTCSNGYFVSPFLNSLSERFVLERDKGAIAAFSPSGLSLDWAAHLYHRALVQELVSGGHGRIGDLVLAAQKRYADTGAFPELLSIYHLFADPALRIAN